MSIKGLLYRFFVLYVGLLAASAVVMHYLALKINTGVNAGILIGAIYLVCSQFARKNHRHFTPGEKKTVMFSLIGVDIGVQLALTLIYVVSAHKVLSLIALVVSVGFIELWHGVVIFFTVSSFARNSPQTVV